MRSCYTLAVLLRTIFNMRNVVPNLEWSNTFTGYGTVQNLIIRTFIWPMPRVEDILAKLGKAKYFTTLDLRSGYHHIALDKQSIKKTAFCTPFGKYEYLKVPFWFSTSSILLSNANEQGTQGVEFCFCISR